MGIKEKLPLLRNSHKIVRLFGYVIYTFVAIIILGAILPSHDNDSSSATTTKEEIDCDAVKDELDRARTVYWQNGENYLTTRQSELIDHCGAGREKDYVMPAEQETKIPEKDVAPVKSAASSSASNVQTYPTDFGDISIEIPYKLEPKDGYDGTDLHLVKPGMEKPIFSILLEDPWGEDLEGYAAGMVGEDKTFTEMTTDDGHRVLFVTTDAGLDREGKPVYHYYGFIDYLNEKNMIVEIFSYSKIVLNGDVIAVYSEGTFQNICKSFTFVSLEMR